MSDSVVISIIGGVSGISLLATIVNTIVANSLKRTSDQHNILWDAHNEKKSDSMNLKNLSTKFTEHENKFLEFTLKQDNRNNILDTKLEQIEIAVKHKDNNQQTLVQGIFDMLVKMQDKQR